MQMLQNFDQGGSNVGVILNQRLKTLRELATSLLSEVEEMESVRSPDLKGGISIHDEVRRYEIELIRHALRLTSGHQARAARLLNIKTTTLNSKIKRYKLLPSAT